MLPRPQHLAPMPPPSVRPWPPKRPGALVPKQRSLASLGAQATIARKHGRPSNERPQARPAPHCLPWRKRLRRPWPRRPKAIRSMGAQATCTSKIHWRAASLGRATAFQERISEANIEERVLLARAPVAAPSNMRPPARPARQCCLLCCPWLPRPWAWHACGATERRDGTRAGVLRALGQHWRARWATVAIELGVKSARPFPPGGCHPPPPYSSP